MNSQLQYNFSHEDFASKSLNYFRWMKKQIIEWWNKSSVLFKENHSFVFTTSRLYWNCSFYCAIEKIYKVINKYCFIWKSATWEDTLAFNDSVQKKNTEKINSKECEEELNSTQLQSKPINIVIGIWIASSRKLICLWTEMSTHCLSIN